MADKKISQLPPLVGAVSTSDALAIADNSAALTKKITPKDLIQSGIALIDNGSIPVSKVDGTISADIADGSITAIKLSDNSSGVVTSGALPNGVRVGQVGLSTSDNNLYIWDGSGWRAIKAPDSINSITVNQGIVEIAVQDNGDGTVTLSPGLANTTGPRQFLAGPTNSAGLVTQRQIIGADVPAASTSERGTIIVSGGGLTVNAAGLISIDNAVTAETTRSLATWDSNGLVQGGSPIEPGDLPIATTNSNGVVKPGVALRVDNTGSLTIDNDISSGTFPKVAVSSKGLVTAGESLTESDIPALSADKITSGQFGTARLLDNAVTMPKLADYSTAYIQETQPTVSGDLFIGALWFQPLEAQLRMFDGNVWSPIGFGRLSQENLRWGGLINASTGLLTGVTSAGTTAGFAVGDSLPTATNALGGIYVLVSTAGDQIGVTPGVSYDSGDWCLCINATDGWTRIDIAASGGGGGGAQSLGDLLDVSLSGLIDGDLFQYQTAAGNQWTNIATLDLGTF